MLKIVLAIRQGWFFVMLSSDKLEQLKNWRSRQPLKLGVLFGSQATGQARPDSDSAELDPALRDFAQFVSLFEQQLDKN